MVSSVFPCFCQTVVPGFTPVYRFNGVWSYEDVLARLSCKIPENPVITPTSSTQVVRPSAANRFLQTVTVNPIPTTPTP
jgi:hypothetical protein